MGFWKADKPPPAPDYTAPAIATAEGNLDATRAAAMANRIDQFTPYGNIRYRQVGNNPDHWESRVHLSPAEQRQLKSDNRLSERYGEIAEGGLKYVSRALDKPFDWRNLPARSINAGQTAQQALLARLEPQFDRDEESMRTRLINQGITSGSDASNTELDRFNRAKTDARLQAALQGFDVGERDRQSAIQEQSFARNEPLNMVNALRSGTQVNLPTFGAPGQQQTTTGPDLLGAANMGYNAQLGGYNAQAAGTANNMNGLYNIGAAALLRP